MRTLFRLAAALLFLVFLVLVGTFVYFDQQAQTPRDPSGEAEPKVLLVKKGTTLSKLGGQLEQEQLIHSDLVWKVYLKLHRDAPKPKAGRHRVHGGMNIPELLQALNAKPLSEDVPLTMVEGWRLRDADAWMAERGLIEKGAYIRAANQPARYKVLYSLEKAQSLAGYLLPETFLVPKGKVDVDKLIQRQVDAFAEKFWKTHAAEVKKSGRTLRQIVIMASLLEREEPNPKNRQTVAGILFKRLDANQPLGVDATSRFNLVDWNSRPALLRALRDPNDPYNTRLRVGLPPTPIGAPSLDALIAALRPKKSPYWYYLHDQDKQIHYARTAAEHTANRKRYRVW